MNQSSLLHSSALYRGILKARRSQRKAIIAALGLQHKLQTSPERFVDKRRCSTTRDRVPLGLGLNQVRTVQNGLCLGLVNNREIKATELLASRIAVHRQTTGKLQVEPVFACHGLEFLVEQAQQQQLLSRNRSSRRSESLHKDIRTTSLMCLTDGMHNIYPAHLWKEQNDGTMEKGRDIKELPAVFMIEESQINALLTVISSNFVEFQLKDKLLKLVNEILHVDRLMRMIAKPHNRSADDITCNGNSNCESGNELGMDDKNDSDYHVTQDQSRINDIIQEEWRENDIKNCGYWYNHVDNARLKSVPPIGHVYFRRGVPHLTSKDIKTQDKALNDKRPSSEQLHLMLEKLTEEMPSFFEKHHDFSIYSSDILFENKIFRLKTRGLMPYKGSIQSMKYSSFVYFADVQMEVLKITLQQEHDNIQVRWRVKGVPVHSHYVNKILRRKSKYRYIDAFSTFYIGQDGLIYRHVLDKVMPSPEEKAQAMSWVQRLALSLGLVRSPSLAGDWNSNTK
ncbi:uncharacterized protein LOC117108028 [Anneissia japonica]|uniref:uncharacterized protein LOC117108028 n=1 Tax=Anneissia japonica TaxID=1529436 RepID=UPI001425ABE2|nr:uncharacterized protein LOC117108028 [Anneissia japonica]